MIKLRVVTPNGRYLEETVSSIHAKSVLGEFTILPNHVPVVFSLVPCKLVIHVASGQEQVYAISGGILQFYGDEARLLTDAIEGKAEIDIPRAKAALERARKRMEKQGDLDQMRRAELAMRRAINRLSVTDSL
ncbi:ATP synthase F1 subunit epsilon [Allobaculum fili]|uniref:ATP synthase F1 subunit epsilon n=1 Tax=Allobaculum fili TaxID=2834460 RepID=UPI001E5D46EE